MRAIQFLMLLACFFAFSDGGPAPAPAPTPAPKTKSHTLSAPTISEQQTSSSSYSFVASTSNSASPSRSSSSEATLSFTRSRPSPSRSPPSATITISASISVSFSESQSNIGSSTATPSKQRTLSKTQYPSPIISKSTMTASFSTLRSESRSTTPSESMSPSVSVKSKTQPASETATDTSTITPPPTQSRTPSASYTQQQSQSRTFSMSMTYSTTVSQSQSASETYSMSMTYSDSESEIIKSRTATHSYTPTNSSTPSDTVSEMLSVTDTMSTSESCSTTASTSKSRTPTIESSRSATRSFTDDPSLTLTLKPVKMRSRTSSESAKYRTSTVSGSVSVRTRTITPTPSRSPSSSCTQQRSQSGSFSMSSTYSITLSKSQSASNTYSMSTSMSLSNTISSSKSHSVSVTRSLILTDRSLSKSTSTNAKTITQYRRHFASLSTTKSRATSMTAEGHPTESTVWRVTATQALPESPSLFSLTASSTLSLTSTHSKTLSKTLSRSFCVPFHIHYGLISSLDVLMIGGDQPSGWTVKANFAVATAFTRSDDGGIRYFFASQLQPIPSDGDTLQLRYQREAGASIPRHLLFVVRLQSDALDSNQIGTTVPSNQNAQQSLSFTVVVATASSLNITVIVRRAEAVSPYQQIDDQITVSMAGISCYSNDRRLKLTITLVPVPLVVSVASLKASNNILGMMSIATMSPTAGTSVARLAMLSKFVDCYSSPTENDGTSIVGLKYGHEVGQYYRGAVLGNVALTAGFLCLVILFALVRSLIVSCRIGAAYSQVLSSSLNMFHVPSVVQVPLSQILVPTISASVELCIVSGWQASGDLLIAAIGISFVMTLVISFSVALLCRFPCTLRPREMHDLGKARKRFEDAVTRVPLLVKKDSRRTTILVDTLCASFVAPVHWKVSTAAHGGKQWKKKFLMLFDDYCVVWYPVVDWSASVIMAVMGGLPSLNRSEVCLASIVVSAAVMMTLLVLCVTLKPSITRSGNVLLILTNIFGCCSLGAMLVNKVSPVAIAVDVATFSIFCSSIVSSLVLLPNAIQMVSVLISGLSVKQSDSGVKEEPLPLTSFVEHSADQAMVELECFDIGTYVRYLISDVIVSATIHEVESRLCAKIFFAKHGNNSQKSSKNDDTETELNVEELLMLYHTGSESNVVSHIEMNTS